MCAQVSIIVIRETFVYINCMFNFLDVSLIGSSKSSLCTNVNLKCLSILGRLEPSSINGDHTINKDIV